MIRHYRHILHIWVLDIDAMVSRKKLFFLPFLVESKFFYQMRQTWILIIISKLSMIAHHKLVTYIRIYDFNALVLQKMFIFPPFSLESMFIHQKRQTRTLVIIFMLCKIGHHKHILLKGIGDVDALVLQEMLFRLLFSIE